MRLGISLSHSGDPDFDGHAFVDHAKMAERIGFDGLWFFDTVGRGRILPDPLIAASVAAAVTTTPTVGTCILQVPLRRPVELAHRILTAHLMTNGRLRLGVGAGSTQKDFDAVGADYEARFRDFAKALPLMRALWNGDTVGPACLDPWPKAVGGPQVLIGSWAGSRWIPRAAQIYDGWISSAARTSLGALKEGIVRFRDAGGKQAVVANVRVDFSQPTTEPMDEEPFHLRCAPDAAAERLAALKEMGYEEAICIAHPFDEETLTTLRSLMPR